MLIESGAGDQADIARAAEDAHGLGLCVRSLVGLDREAATDAFSEYLADTTFTVDQIRVVNLIFPDDVLDGLILTLDTVRAHGLAEATVA